MNDNSTHPVPIDPAGAKRRQQLIDATVRTVAEYGISRTTVARVTEFAGLSPGIVNFYFKTKDAMLLATLRALAEEFESALNDAIRPFENDASAALDAVINTWFEPSLSDARKVAVWFAFWSESQARDEYIALCGDLDAACRDTFLRLVSSLTACSEFAHVDAEAVARGFEGILDTHWQQILVDGEAFDRDAAKSVCRRYLRSVFPGRFDAVGAVTPATPVADALPRTLPAWIYQHPEFFALEQQTLFATAWQIVCHISEMAQPGDYVTFESDRRRAFVVRDEHGELRAFHNVCRHRAHEVVSGERGHCDRFLQCRYHGWAYRFDGRLRAVPAEKTFPGLDKSVICLPQLELEVFLGFVFIRFAPGDASVAERMAPFRAELAAYRFPDMVPFDALWNARIDIDWKNVMDNYLEDYHFPIGHPGLYGLMETTYERDVRAEGVSRLSHRMRDTPSAGWSEHMYHRLLPARKDLPEDLRRRWSYVTLFPNVTFDIYPDRMDYYEMLPLAPGRCRLRGRSYVLPDARREMRAVRYLNKRINKTVQREDVVLTASVQTGLASGAYTTGILSGKEIVVHGFHDWLRERLPVAGLDQPPRGPVAVENERLMARRQPS